MSHVTSCLNCEENLSPEAKFCSECGQKTDTHRLTLGHFFHEVFHAFTHADKGIFYLIKGLALHPGVVAREYLAGKRKKYFNPFTFFLLLMTVYVLSDTLFQKKKEEAISSAEQFSQMPEGPEKTMNIARYERGIKVKEFGTKHGNMIAMIAVPYFAFLFWAVYRKRKYNYAEHLTSAVLFIGFSNMVFTLVVFPLASLFGGTIKNMMPLLGLVFQIAYFAWAYNSLLSSKTTGQKLGVFVTSFTGVLLWSILTFTVFAIYIYQSWDFLDFFKRMGGRG